MPDLRTIILFSMLLASFSRVEAVEPSWREDFKAPVIGAWRLEGRRLLVAPTRFYLKEEPSAEDNGALVVESNRSTAMYLCDMSKNVDLEKTPIMRWRWRVHKLPQGADGRPGGKDDQAIAIYIGTGTVFRQHGLAYRWETETPCGYSGKRIYGGIMSIYSFCLQNKESAVSEWIVETRNIRDDFKSVYGSVPKRFALSIGGNSQHTQSSGLAEIDYIEFISEPQFLAETNNNESSGKTQ